jgi:uncharacterized membrane protein YdjX (TVP38/TMEM64 family)
MPGESDRTALTDRHVSVWKPAVSLVLLCGVLVAIASSDLLHQGLLRLVDAAKAVVNASPLLGMSGFVVLAAASAVLAFFSSTVLVPVAVDAWGNGLSLFLLWTGWWLGGMCTYGVGRSLGRSLVVYMVSVEALTRFESRITARAPFGLVLLFQFALPSEIPGYVLGLARYNFGKYLLALGLAELPYAVGAIYLGESVLQRRVMVLVAIGVAGALLAAWALRTLQKRLAD